MATKKFKTFCKIMDYVESVKPELAELLRGTCADMTLNSTKGKPGITFLMPQDEKYIKQIADLAYSEDPKNANEACDMLNALILRDVFKSPSDFIAKRTNIPNSLYPSQHVGITGIEGKGIKFESGATAVPDPGFIDSSRKSNIAVWKLTGTLPHKGGKPANIERVNRGKGGKVGAYQPSNDQSRSLRFQIGLAVENAYALHCLQKQSGVGGEDHDPFCKHSLSIINYINKEVGNVALLHDTILPLISLDKLDFYLLVEPHRTTGSYIIDDNTLADWWSKKRPVDCKAITADIQSLLKSGQDALVYTDRKSLLDCIHRTRKSLITQIDAKPRDCVDLVAKIYEELSLTNSIGGLSPVFPPGLAQIYKNEPALKMLQDDLRYYVYSAFNSLERRFDLGGYNELLNVIGECLYAATIEEMRSSQRLLNKTVIKYMIAPSERISQVKQLINSTMFIYIPITRDDSAALAKSSIQRPDPDSRVIWNIQGDVYTRYNHVLNATDLELEKLLSGISDPAIRDAIKARLNL